MAEPDTVHFQAHRGGQREAPENTLAAFERTWSLGGIPEADIRTTADGQVICLHDDTLARTTDAPEDVAGQPVSELSFEELRRWDAATHWRGAYPRQPVPSLAEVFDAMRGRTERQVYLDLKGVDLTALGRHIGALSLGRQIIFCHNVPENLVTFRRLAPEVRTMLWIGGTTEQIQGEFERVGDEGFVGLDQVQLHLHRADGGSATVRYQIGEEFLRSALATATADGVDLEVLPFEFDDASLGALLELGIRWYAADYPERFVGSVQRWRDGLSPRP